MNRIILLLLLVTISSLFTSFTFSQTSFTYLVSTIKDERIFDCTEDDMGNFIMVGRKVTANPYESSAYILALNSEGQLVFEQEFINNDTLSYFSNIYFNIDSIIIMGAKGMESTGYMNELWILIMNNEFNVIKNVSYHLEGFDILDLESIIKKDGNILLCGIVDNMGNPDIFFYEITFSGEPVNSSVLALEGNQFECDLIEKNNGGYIVFANGTFPGAPQTPGLMVEFDSLYNYISSDSVPYGLYFNHSSKWLNHNEFLVTGNKHIWDANRSDISIIKLNSENELINGNHYYRTPDSTSYVGASSNLDVFDSNTLYFGGTSNIITEHLIYQPEKSYIFLNNLDSNLYPRWQRFYGGDAFYYLWGLKATQDGGCIMLATRYDTAYQDQEFDAIILKVDSAGLLTSIGEGPQIPVQQLAIVPNPASNIVSIRYPDIFGDEDKEIEIFNSLGTPVFKVSAKQNLSETRMDVSCLPVGLYYVVLKVEGKKVATGKMIKI